MKITEKFVMVLGYGSTLSFLFIHIIMYHVFKLNNVTPMVRLNVFSIVFYSVMLFVVYKRWNTFYSIAVYIEVLVHMTMAIVLTGWDSGFQISIIGMSILLFNSEYLGRVHNMTRVRMMPMGIVGMICYLGSYIWLSFHPAKYRLSDIAVFKFNVFWGMAVFLIVLFVMQIFVNITTSHEEGLNYMLSHDKLTDLPNRYFISAYLEHLVKENKISDSWIAIVDIDNFKQVNDTYGHNCGDYVLRKVADVIKISKEYVPCRWGGEEFVLVGNTAADMEHINYLLDDLRAAMLRTNFTYEGQKLDITITIGLEKYEGDLTVDNWIKRADDKLYRGKQSGIKGWR